MLVMHADVSEFPGTEEIAELLNEHEADMVIVEYDNFWCRIGWTRSRRDPKGGAPVSRISWNTYSGKIKVNGRPTQDEFIKFAEYVEREARRV